MPSLFNTYLSLPKKVTLNHACIDATTNRQILEFDPFPDDQKDIDEYRRRIRESLETANKLIADGVANAKITGKFGVQVVIRPVRRVSRTRAKQKRLNGF